MVQPTRPVPPEQSLAFEKAIAERLNVDASQAVLNSWHTDGEDGFVTLDFHLPADELLEIFITGRTEHRSLRTRIKAAADAQCACDGAGCEESYVRRVMLSLLDEDDD